MLIDTANDHNTQETAKRVAKMLVREVFAGRYEPKPRVTSFPNANQYDELLRETISAALAADIAYAVTSSNPTAANMYELFQSKLKEARFVDATEGYNTNPDNGQSDVIGASSFINSRY